MRIVKNIVVWYVRPYSPVDVHRRFGGAGSKSKKSNMPQIRRPVCRLLITGSLFRLPVDPEVRFSETSANITGVTGVISLNVVMATAVRTSSLWRLERCDAVYLEESDVSRENIASIFSVREQFKQETSRSRRQANQKTVFFIVSNVRS